MERFLSVKITVSCLSLRCSIQPNDLKILERFNKVREVWNEVLSADSRAKLHKMEKMGPPLLTPHMCIRTLTKNDKAKSAKVNKLVDELFSHLTNEKEQYQSDMEKLNLVLSFKAEIEKCVSRQYSNC
jgi:hypothetical protein